jgi:regulator of protease activity HflC (stomatin/prohibitin superfamily)
MNKSLKGLIAGVSSLVVAITMFVAFFDIVPIKGNQIGVKENWSSGVNKEPLPPGTYLAMPWERIVPYSTSVQVFVMNDKAASEGETATGRDHDSYLVQSKDSQDLHLSLQVQWRIDPAHVVNLHKTVGADHIEERVLRPTLLRIVKDEATTREAIAAYSGSGLVALQQAIEKDLNKTDGELAQRGIIVDSFVIEHIKLDAEYVKEITARQIAIQRELRAVQEEKAAQAEALQAKAVAQSSLNKAVVEAQSQMQVAVLKAEGEAKKITLASQARKDSAELEAAAIIATGKANAESEKLKYAAYAAPGAEVYARIQIAASMAEAFGNIKGYIPENMTIFTMSDSFQKAVENIVGQHGTAAPATK